MLNDMCEIVMTVDDKVGNTDVGQTASGQKFPIHPGERPTKAALRKWCNSWQDDLSGAGFGAMLRGQEPYEVQKLKARSLLTVPADAEPAKKAALEAENERIQHTNDINKNEKDSRLLEIKTRLAALIDKSMRDVAPIRLAELHAKHQCKDEHGAVIADAHDGFMMFADEKARVTTSVSENDAKKYSKAYEKMRDTKPVDNLSADAFSKRINLFTVHINPYLEENLSGARLGRFILSQLPSALDVDGRALRRELDDKDELKDSAVVLAKCLTLVEQAHDPTKKAAPGVHLLAEERAAAMAAATAAAAAASAAKGKGMSKSEQTKAIEKAVTAALASKSGAPKGGGDGGKRLGKGNGPSRNRLPEGERCSKGTCNFAHDKLKPGAPCFRDPRWGGPLPKPTHDDAEQRARIVADREAEAKRLGVACLPLAEPTAGMAAQLADMGQDQHLQSLMDMLGGAGYMLDVAGGMGDEALDGDEALEFWGVDEAQCDVLTPGLPGAAVDCPPCDEPDDLVESLARDIGAEVSIGGAFGTPGVREPVDDSAVQTDGGAGVGVPRRLAFGTETPDEAEPGTPKPRAMLGDAAATRHAVHEPPPTVEQPKVDKTKAVESEPVQGPDVPPAPPLVQPEEAPSFFQIPVVEYATRILMATALVCVAGILLVGLVHGTAGLHAVGLQMAAALWQPRELGASTAMVALGMGGNALPAPLAVAPWPKVTLGTTGSMLAALAAILYVAEWTIVTWAIAGVAYGYRCARAALSSAALRRRARDTVGTFSILLLFFMLLQGTGGQPLTGRARAVATAARHGSELLGGPIGAQARFLLDDMSMRHHDCVAMPAFLNAEDSLKLSKWLGQDAAAAIDVGDTGAAIHVRKDFKGAIPGSKRSNTTAVLTANGSVTPPWKVDVLQTLRCTDGCLTSIILRDALVMEDCAHNLVSLGKLARDEQMGTWLAPGNEQSHLTLSNGKKAPLLNLGILIIPDASAKMVPAMSAVAQGARRVKHVDGPIVHARGNHTSVRTLREWHRCTADVPREWSQAVRDRPCDSCLEGVAPEVPSDGHVPTVSSPGELVSYDVFSLGVKHVHGGQIKVWGAHDHYSKLNWVVLLRDESTEEISRALREFHAYCRSKNVTIRRVHTDNARAHLSKEVVAIVRDELKARYTTISPNTPRSNGAMERQWRTMGSEAVKMLHKSKLPRNYAWYALAQSVAVRNTLPLSEDPDNCPLSLFTGIKPKASQFRVWGCVVYAKVFDRVTKMSNQAVRCINLGPAPNQSGYICYEPETKRIHVSIHCRFVETALPGLVVGAEGYERVVPDFADDFDEAAERAADGEFVETDMGSILDGIEPEPLVTEGGDELIGIQGGGDADAGTGTGTAAGAPEAEAATHRVRTRAGAHVPVPHAPGAPAAMQRPLRAGVNYSRRDGGGARAALLTIMAAALGALQPGGMAMGTQFLGLNDQAQGRFLLYLCSGPQREGDVAHWMRTLSASEIYVLDVDTMRGGYEHDIADATVAARLKALAERPECMGVLATIPCSTWSPARFVQPGPKPLRNQTFPSGIPDEKGNVAAAVERANAIARNAIAIADAAAAHGAHFVFENPVGRQRGSQFAITGREEHAPLWSLPEMIEFAERHGNHTIFFDQCRTGAATQKTTQLLCSASIVGALRQRLGHMVCNHASGTHAPIVGEQGTEAAPFKTKAAENFTSELNRLLVESFLSPKPSTAGWMASVGSAVESFATPRTLAAMTVIADATIALRTDENDPLSLLRGIQATYFELDDEGRAEAASIMREVSPIAQALACERDPSAFCVTAFKVSAANRHSDDHPSYRQAMSGPERAQWCEACESEMANFEREGIFKEVPEDSLSTWHAGKRRASEVVDMIWVLKKKYNQLRELLKYKARGTIRGDQEAAADQRKGLQPEATFAPTVRHNTLKLLIASGVVRAAEREKAAAGKPIAARGPPLRMRTFDVTAAFLRGKSLTGRKRYVRPPDGYRKHDRRGVPIVYELEGNCYGRCVAPRIWYVTMHEYLIDELKMQQSEADRCYYFKVYKDGTRLDLGLYVDDAWLIDDAGAAADADIAKLGTKFEIKVDETPEHFLNMNVQVLSPTRVKLTSEAYILSMADKYVPNWRERAPIALPSTEALEKAYEAAQLREVTPTAEALKRYQGKVGALVYTSPCVRVDTCYTIGRLGRGLTFPTPALEACADDVIVYLAQTASDGLIFDGHAPDAGTLRAESDSDWAVGHSTTGWVLFLAGVAVMFSSKRQACIAMSSTEAEIIAASACAVEAVHARRLLADMGLPQEATPVYVDNSGAVELARDRKSCHRSRHVDRRYFKIRELVAAGELTVEHIDTKLNAADLLTKSLKQPLYTEHRSRLMRVPRA